MHLIPNSLRRPCWTRSRPSATAATDGCWRSTATRIGSIRSAWRKGEPLVAKFYRPGRWTDAAIREEHAFAAELAAAEIPVVAPLIRDGVSLHVQRGFRYAIFPRRGGRWPELGTADDREWVGRFLGRIHAVGRAGRFHDRTRLSVADLGRNARDFVLEGDWMPDYLADKYAEVTDELLDEVEARAEGWAGPSSAAFWAIATAAISYGRIWARTSSISTTV